MWEKINKFNRSHSIIAALFLSIFFMITLTASVVLLMNIGMIETMNNTDPVYLLFLTIVQITLSCVAILLMRKMQVFNINDFKFINMGKCFSLGWYNFVYIAGAVFFMVIQIPENSLIMPSVAHLTITILFPFLGTALFEELVFRGLVLKILLVTMGDSKRGIFKACIISAVIFGIVHIVNLIHAADTLAVIAQVIYASFLGLFYAVLFLRTKTLWIPIILHGLTNLSIQIFNAIIFIDNVPTQTEPNIIVALIPLIFAIPFIIVGLVLLKKVTPDDIGLLMGKRTK